MQIQYTKTLKIAGHEHTKTSITRPPIKITPTVFSLENPQFSSFLTCCFYSLERLLFLSRIFSDTFFLSFLPMLKRWKNCQFLTKTFQKNPNFSTVLTCFYGPDRLFRSRILSNTSFCRVILPILKRWKTCEFLTNTMD